MLLKTCYLLDAISFVKSIVFFELFEALLFSIIFTFRIGAIKLFIFLLCGFINIHLKYK